MSGPRIYGEERPAVGGTSLVLSAGTVASAACFVVGFVLGLLGVREEALDPLRLDQVAASVVGLRPAGWSTLGTLVLLATPAAALVASFVELRRARSLAAWFAVALLGILVAATLVALASR